MSYHGKDSYFAVEDGVGSTLRAISPYITSVNFNQGNDQHDNTTQGAQGHTAQNGLTNGSIVVNGLYDKTAVTGSDTVLQSLIGIEATVGFEFGPEGNANGMTKKSGECNLETYALSAPVADLVAFTANFNISGSVTVGTFSA